MYLVINKCVTAVKLSNFSGHYLRNHSTLDIDVLGYMGIVQHKEHSPEVLSIPPGTPCISSFESPILDFLHVRHFRRIVKSNYELRHVSGSVCPHARNPLQLDRLSLNSYSRIFRKPV